MIIITLVILFACNQDEQEELLFNRSQCIVEVELRWADSIEFKEKQDLLGLISDSFGKDFLDNYELTPPSMSYKGENNEYIYIQYRNHCLKKYNVTRDIISRIFPEFIGYIEFSMSNDIIHPGMNTINVQGRSWIKDW